MPLSTYHATIGWNFHADCQM